MLADVHGEPDLSTYTVGMYSPGKAFVVYEINRHVCGVVSLKETLAGLRGKHTFPTAPSPVTTHYRLIVSFVRVAFILLFVSGVDFEPSEIEFLELPFLIMIMTKVRSRRGRMGQVEVCIFLDVGVKLNCMKNQRLRAKIVSLLSGTAE